MHENVEIGDCFSSRMTVNGSLMNNSDELSPQTRKLERELLLYQSTVNVTYIHIKLAIDNFFALT